MQKNTKRPIQKQVRKTGTAAQEKTNSRRMLLLYLGIIALAVFITFYPTLKSGFVNWDDDVNVYKNPNIEHLTPGSVKRIFTTPVMANYNPLPVLTFAIEKQFFGLDPMIYHLDNLLFHILNSLLVFFIALGLGLKRPAALFLALLFGLHPMRVESLAWVTERKDVLLGLFTFAAILCYITWVKGNGKKYLLLAYLFFIVSVFAKIQAVALPLSLLAIDDYMNRPMNRKRIFEKIPMFLISLAVGLLGSYLLSKQHLLDIVNYSLVEKLLIGTYSLVIYAVKSMIPYELSAIYPFPVPGDFPLFFYITPLFVLALVFAVFLSRKQTKVLVFGTTFFFFNILFLLQIVAAGQGFVADRYSYVPFFGLFFIYAWGFQWLLENRPGSRPVLWVIMIAVVLILAGVCRNRVYAWKDSETLWTDVISKYKNVPLAYNNRGIFYRESKQFDKALADYDAGLKINPKDYNGFNSRGRLLFEQGQADKALADFNRSIGLNPKFAKAWSNRGAVYGMKKEYQLAADDLTRSLELNPKEMDARSNRALVYYYLGRFREAASDCRTYLNSRDDEASMWDLASVCYKNLEKYDSALACADKAIELDPSTGAFYLNRSFIHFAMKDKVKALADAEKAVNAGMKVEEVYLRQLK